MFNSEVVDLDLGRFIHLYIEAYIANYMASDTSRRFPSNTDPRCIVLNMLNTHLRYMALATSIPGTCLA